MSLMFEFDRDVFSSVVYNRYFRDLLKYRIRIHEESGWLMVKRTESPSEELEGFAPNDPSPASMPSPTQGSNFSTQEYPETSVSPLQPVAVIPLFQDNQNIIDMALSHMDENCARFTLSIAEHMPKLHDKHHLSSLAHTSDKRDTPLDLLLIEKFWKHRDFLRLLQGVLAGGLYTTPQNGPYPETIAQM